MSEQVTREEFEALCARMDAVEQAAIIAQSLASAAQVTADRAASDAFAALSR